MFVRAVRGRGRRVFLQCSRLYYSVGFSHQRPRLVMLTQGSLHCALQAVLQTQRRHSTDSVGAASRVYAAHGRVFRVLHACDNTAHKRARTAQYLNVCAAVGDTVTARQLQTAATAARPSHRCARPPFGASQRSMTTRQRRSERSNGRRWPVTPIPSWAPIAALVAHQSADQHTLGGDRAGASPPREA